MFRPVAILSELTTNTKPTDTHTTHSSARSLPVHLSVLRDRKHSQHTDRILLAQKRYGCSHVACWYAVEMFDFVFESSSPRRICSVACWVSWQTYVANWKTTAYSRCAASVWKFCVSQLTPQCSVTCYESSTVPVVLVASHFSRMALWWDIISLLLGNRSSEYVLLHGLLCNGCFTGCNCTYLLHFRGAGSDRRQYCGKKGYENITVEPRFTNASHHEQIGSRTNCPEKKNVSGDERCLE
jgi:hypothetical protein